MFKLDTSASWFSTLTINGITFMWSIDDALAAFSTDAECRAEPQVFRGVNIDAEFQDDSYDDGWRDEECFTRNSFDR